MLTLTFASIFFACNTTDPNTNDQQGTPIDTDTDECVSETPAERANWDEKDGLDEVTAGGLNFGLDLVPEMVADDENLFFSPFSISTALGMVHLGANEQTAEQLESVLHMLEDTQLWHQTSGELIQDLHQPERCDYTLTIANRVYGQKGMALDTNYTQALLDHYGAPVEEADFMADSEAERQKINQWISENTMEKIPELFPEGTINSNTRVVLANAMYMNAPWKIPFPESRTIQRSFYLEDGTSVSVDTMHSDEIEFGFASLEKADLFELDYEGDELKMVVLLPHQGIKVSEIEAELNMEVLRTWQDEVRSTSSEISFPKMEIRSKVILNEALDTLGMPDAFDSQAADFSGLTEEADLFIQTVIHEAWVKIDEGGTEAAAATGVSMGVESAPMIMEINRPFVYLVQDRLSETVLFYGRVMNPAAE